MRHRRSLRRCIPRSRCPRPANVELDPPATITRRRPDGSNLRGRDVIRGLLANSDSNSSEGFEKCARRSTKRAQVSGVGTRRAHANPNGSPRKTRIVRDASRTTGRTADRRVAPELRDHGQLLVRTDEPDDVDPLPDGGVECGETLSATASRLRRRFPGAIEGPGAPPLRTAGWLRSLRASRRRSRPTRPRWCCRRERTVHRRVKREDLVPGCRIGVIELLKSVDPVGLPEGRSWFWP